jgi:PAS domain S-box-containing protein
MNYQKNLRKKHFKASVNNLFSVESLYINFAFIFIMTLVGVRSLEGLLNVLGVCIVAMGILVLFLSTIKQKDTGTESLSLVGIAFGIASSFYITMISHKVDVSVSEHLVTMLSLSASYLQATGILLFSVFSNRKNSVKKFSLLFCVTALVLQVIIWYKVPENLTESQLIYFTKISDYLEYILFLYYTVILLIISRKSKKINFNNMPAFKSFILLNISFVLIKAFFTIESEILALILLAVKLIAYAILFKVLVESKIKRPIEEMHNQVIDISYSLSVKNKSLQETVDELEKQIISRLKYEKKLKYTEEKYQKIVDNSPETIYIHQGDRIIFMNKAARNFFALGHNETLEGISIFSLIESDNIEVMKERLRKTQVEKEDCPTIELLCHCFDGSAKTLEIADICINLDGKNVTLSIGRDITIKRKLEEEHKRLIEAMEYEKVRSSFFSNISHELRTPVNLIYSSLQVREVYRRQENNQENNNDKDDYYHITMKQNCLRLIRTINNIIDISTMDSGYYTPSCTSVEIVSLFEDMTEAVATYMTDKEKYIIFDTDIEEKEMTVDRSLLERMLLNLLSNAVKFSDQEDNIEVSLFSKEKGIELRVRDYGIGIPEEQLPEIFDKFKQVDKSLRRGKEGSGLGLALVQSIVDLHGGSITIQSNLGLGTTVIVYIPNKLIEDRSNTYYEDSSTDYYADYYTDYCTDAYMETAVTKVCDGDYGHCKNCGHCTKIDRDCIDKVILEFSDIYF